ncbi:hypothetical protein N7447_010806 [Penicillium robsamsonii]|uniref:uncharacterized protein n=1 Tax=Penicillium robsamsonii TaxID=1792511 RepID=UPI00254806EB|nr:uncharacterized protein N7447_010806 [Penicillium robsamsonii]KAJ5807350.1 hypothetical protein N7447_010806 [Penicillium robsamsonii]
MDSLYEILGDSPGILCLFKQGYHIRQQYADRDNTETQSSWASSLIWDRNRNTHGSMNLCRVLAGIAHDGKVLPLTDQMMTQDPRLCRTAASFPDVIRHMILNLYDITLSYQAETDSRYYQIDAFRSQWKVLHGIFSDSANTNFVIRVLLDVHDYRNREVYETTELPPVYRILPSNANHTSTCSDWLLSRHLQQKCSVGFLWL